MGNNSKGERYSTPNHQVDIGEKRAGKRGKDMERKGKGKGKEVKRKEIKWPKAWYTHAIKWRHKIVRLA